MDVDEESRVRSLVVRWWPAGALLLVVGLGALVVGHPGPLPGELGYIRGLQDLGEPVPTIAELVRVTTGTEAALLVFAVPAGWFIGRRDRHGVIVVAIAAVTMLVAQPSVKDLVDRPRPSPQVVDVRADTESESFPSGHSMSSTTVWGAVTGMAWARRRRAIAAAAALPVVLTFVAGGVQGVHWPSDAIGGTALGAVAAWLIVPQALLAVRTPRDGRRGTVGC